MSAIHNELRRGQLSTAILTALGASEGLVERFSETLQPVFDPWSLPEHALYRDELLGSFPTNVAAAAGFRSVIGVLNPTGSEKLLVIMMVWATSNTAGGMGNIATGWSGNAGWNPGSLNAVPRLDRRWSGDPDGSPVLAARWATSNSGTIVPFGTVLAQRHTATAAYTEFALPVILPPGRVLLVYPGADNQDVRATVIMRERNALPGELVGVRGV